MNGAGECGLVRGRYCPYCLDNNTHVGVDGEGSCSSGCPDYTAFNQPTAQWCYYDGGSSCWIGDKDVDGQPTCGTTLNLIANGNTNAPSNWPSSAPLDQRECPWDLLPESLCGGTVSSSTQYYVHMII